MLQRYQNSSFIKNVVSLSFTTGLAQAIPFLMLPILQKWFYTPEDFGAFSLFVSITSIVFAFSTLKYEFSIVVAKTALDAMHLTIATLAIMLTISLFATLVLYIGSDRFFGWFEVSGLVDYLVWVPVSIIGFSGTQVLSYWLNHHSRFSGIGHAKMVQAVTGEGAKIGGVLTFPHLGAVGLIAGKASGQFFAFLFLLNQFLRKEWIQIRHKFEWKHAFGLLRDHRNFPFFSTPSAILGTIANNLHIILMSAMYSQETIGFIGTAFLYAAVPLGIISSSFSQVFFKRISAIKSRKEFLNVYGKNAGLLFMFGLFGVAGVQLIPEIVITSILGEEWAQSVIYLKIIVWHLLFSFVSSALSPIYIRLERQRIMFLFDMMHVMMVFMAIRGGDFFFHDPVNTIMVFTSAQILFYSMAIGMAFYFIQKSKLLS